MNLAILMSVMTPWARETALRLAELGHNIQVIDFATPLANEGYLHSASQSGGISALREAVAGLHFIETPFSSRLRYLLLPLKLRKILRANKAEKLLTLYGGGNALMAYLCGFHPYAVYLVGSDVMFASGPTRMLARLSLAKAHTVFVNGIYLTHKSRELAPEANLEFLYLGVDTQKFFLSVPAEKPVEIICTRGFLPVYNNEYLVRALAQMKDLPVSYNVTFVSSGPQLEAVRRLADELCPVQVRPRVRFLGGVTEKELVQVLQRGHIYISLSRSDGTSISLLEALACGLFPVLSDIPQNREWLAEGADNIALVPLDQPETLAAVLERVILDADLRQRAGVFNRKLVSRRADCRHNISILSASLESMSIN